MSPQGYRELKVWQKSMDFVTKVYNLTDNFPRSETFGLGGQLRRAAVSVPSNIAEGQGRDSVKEFLHHLSFAYGSLMEAETQVQIAANLGYLGKDDIENLLAEAAEIGRMLNGLSRSLKA